MRRSGGTTEFKIDTSYWLKSEDINILMNAYELEGVYNLEADDVYIAPAICSMSALRFSPWARSNIKHNARKQFDSLCATKDNLNLRIDHIHNKLSEEEKNLCQQESLEAEQLRKKIITLAEQKSIKDIDKIFINLKIDHIYNTLSEEEKDLCQQKSVEAEQLRKKIITLAEQKSIEDIQNIFSRTQSFQFPGLTESELAGISKGKFSYKNSLNDALESEHIREGEVLLDKDAKLPAILAKVDKFANASDKYRILFPYQINDNHWNTVILDVSKNSKGGYYFEVSQIDPKGGRQSFDVEMESYLKSAITEAIMYHNRPKLESSKFRNKKVDAPKLQTDGNSCGAITAKTMFLLVPKAVRNLDVSSALSQDESIGSDKVQIHDGRISPYPYGAYDLRKSQIEMVFKFFQKGRIKYGRKLKEFFEEAARFLISEPVVNTKQNPKQLLELDNHKPYKDTHLFFTDTTNAPDFRARVSTRNQTKDKFTAQVTTNIDTAIKKFNPEDQQFLKQNLKAILRFARENNGVGNAGHEKWNEYFKAEFHEKFNIAKSFSHQYQQISKETQLFTGRLETENLKTKDINGNPIEIGHRLKRISPEIANIVCSEINKSSIAR